VKKAVFLFVLIAITMFTRAQKNFGTGDTEFEKQLNILNSEAKSDLNSFKEDISKELNVSKDRIQELLNKAMEPVEIILSGRISGIAKTDFENVIKSYEKNKDKGWGQIAKDLGINPGSPEFHELKDKPKHKPSSNGNSNGKGNSKGKAKN
jgi:glucan-binding YG repeat protein